MSLLKIKKLKNFRYDAMILIALSRYCNQLIISEIFGFDFNQKQTYKYTFSEEEIKSLATKEESELIFNKKILINFDFEISIFKKRYYGTLEIKTTFINNNSFENSYYLNEIEIKTKEKIKLYPFFLNQNGYNLLISELIQKLWIPVLQELTQTEQKFKLNLLEQIETPLTENNLKNIIKVDENEDLVFDTFHIVYSYLYKKNGVYPLYISADDIMKNRGLRENRNANGYRGGYKNEQKLKIQAALNILNESNLLTIYNTHQFNYIIYPNNKLISRIKNIFNIDLVKFNYKTQLNERRISHYLQGLNKEKIQLNNLVNIILKTTKTLKPMQLRDKFEDIMDNLSDKKIIKNWHYINIEEDKLNGKNWIEKWLKLSIICRY